MATLMNSKDAPSTRLANCYVTFPDHSRYLMMMAKDFEANFSRSTAKVPILGRTGTGHKATGWEGKFKMTIYKCTEIFDDICKKYQETGEDTYFDIQVTSQDPATSIGSSSKIYRNCILDGEILLSMFNADGEFIEQKVEGFFDAFENPVSYTNPDGMKA